MQIDARKRRIEGTIKYYLKVVLPTNCSRNHSLEDFNRYFFKNDDIFDIFRARFAMYKHLKQEQFFFSAYLDQYLKQEGN